MTFKKIIILLLSLFIFINIKLESLATRGCCSHHGGVVGCTSYGVDLCSDGSVSPNRSGNCVCTPVTYTQSKPKKRTVSHKNKAKSVKKTKTYVKSSSKKNTIVKKSNNKATNIKEKAVSKPIKTISENKLKLAKPVLSENYNPSEKNINYNPENLNNYFGQVRNKISYNWEITKNYITYAGYATVSFSIDQNGNVNNLNLIKSSRNYDFDNTVINVIYNSAPFNPPPQEYKGETLNIPFVIEGY